MINNSKIFFPTANCYVSAFNRSHRDRSGGKGLESFWEKVSSFISNGKPNLLNLQLPHTWKNVFMSHCTAMFSCAHSQRSSLKNNTVSLVHSEAPLLCNHLDVPGVSDSRKCLLAASKGGSASSFSDSRKCSSPVSLKQNGKFSLCF